jgi:ADP-ribose pyrophosphatase YjhB (NUDIX family)
MLGDDWRWCPRCGEPLERVHRGGAPRPRCPSCGFLFFANMGIGAAVVVREATGRVLLVRRGPRQYGAGRWCFPCGFVEWGEDVREAAVREAREEAGVDVRLGAVVQVLNNFHEPERPTIGVWFAAELVDPTAVPVGGDDAAEAGWFDPLDPPPLAFPSDVTLLRAIAGRPEAG